MNLRWEVEPPQFERRKNHGNKKASSEEVVTIKPLKMKSVTLTIEGESPLIMHKWNEKAKRELLKEDSALVKERLPRNPFAEAAAASWFMDKDRDPFLMASDGGQIPTFEDWVKKYREYGEEDYIRDMSGARIGFPVTAIKKAALSAAYRLGMSKNKVGLQGFFFIEGEGNDQLIEIKHEGIPEIREDNCKLNGSTADIRYRPQFFPWSVEMNISFIDCGLLKLSELVNLIDAGGKTVGIGEWRVEKSGQYGMYHVATK